MRDQKILPAELAHAVPFFKKKVKRIKIKGVKATTFSLRKNPINPPEIHNFSR